MKLIFDLTKTQPIGNTKFHGGGKYGEIVFKSLASSSKDIIAYYNSEKWLNPEIAQICQDNHLTMVDSNQRSLQETVAEHPGVVYSPIIETDLNNIGDNITYITTVHGLRVLELPYDKYIGHYRSKSFKLGYDLYYKYKSKKTFDLTLKKYREVFQRKNIHVVTVSEHSKASILSFVPYLKQEDIEVFYSPSTVGEMKKVEPYEAGEKYYMMVSADRWVKNALRAAMAFDEIFSERPDFKGRVILTGSKNKHIFDKYIKNPSRFTFIDYVDAKTLLSMYKGAYLFVYPSLNEGFGYPPVEAMTLGTPIIASAISSITEICGDSALYFNPLMVSEIKMRILQMENKEIRADFIRKQEKRVQEVRERQDQDLEKLTQYILSHVNQSVNA